MSRVCFAIVLLGAAGLASGQSVVDPSLKVQTWVRGLDQPTGMVFVDNAGTALVTEKTTGLVRVVSGKRITGTALDLSVANSLERGLLGIALSPTFASDHFVYLDYTRGNGTEDGDSAV